MNLFVFFDSLFAVGFEQDSAGESPLTSSAERTSRTRNLSEQQKAKVNEMQKPSDMEYSETWNNTVGQCILLTVINKQILVCGYTHLQERKRQYSAMRRAIFRDASPELVAKFTLCGDKERSLGFIWVNSHSINYHLPSSNHTGKMTIPLSRFGMLKAWVQNENLAEIEVEEKYVTWVANLRTDRYTTAAWL